MKIEDLSTLKINVMQSQDQYDTAHENGLIQSNEIYLIPEEEIDLSQYATKDYVDEGFISNQGGEINGDLIFDDTSSNNKIIFKMDENYTAFISQLDAGGLVLNSNISDSNCGVSLYLEDTAGQTDVYLKWRNDAIWPNDVPRYLVTSSRIQPDISSYINSTKWQESEEISGVIFAQISEWRITSYDKPIIDIDLSKATTLEEIQTLESFWSTVYRAETGDNILTLYSTASLDEVPEILYINVKVVG